ncbi:TerD family protein [Moraxella osloensis]|nr:TerD family protein [Moraxella osloensis]MDK1669158.1 TerD family protein [Moraxella osloensis]
MAVSLQKGQKISLDKEAGTALTRIKMGLGWDVASTPKSGGFLGGLFGGGGNNDSIDLDASCIMFDASKQPIDAIWFGQLQSKDGSIVHTGDNRTGAGDGDDEVINVDLSRVPAHVQSLVFTVNSFTGQTFEKVANAFCRIVNASNNSEVARYNLSAQGSHTALILAKIYRHNGEWKMHAIGEIASGRTFHDLMPAITPHA